MAYPKTEELVDWKLLRDFSLDFQSAEELWREGKESQQDSNQTENLALNSKQEPLGSSGTKEAVLKKLSNDVVRQTLESQQRFTQRGIQNNKKHHVPVRDQNLALNFPKDEVQNEGKNFGIEQQGQKNLALNSEIQSTLNEGKNSEVDTGIPEVENLALNSLKVSLQNKGKMRIRMGGQVLEITTSHRKRKLESIVDLEVFQKSGWGSGSYSIKVVYCRPKCRGCPHLYLRYRWYEGGRQKERVIGKVNRRGAIE